MSHSGIHAKSLAPLLSFALALALALPATAAAITPVEVLARGERWITRKVPYSQSRFATVTGSLVATAVVNPQRKGYRTDCSGFVSMCMGFRSPSGYPLSLSTATLDDVMIRIRKDDLRAGDVILRPNDLRLSGVRVPYGHAVVFVEWANESHTRYIGYHQSSSQRGAVRDEIEWGDSGFWSAKGFAAYRSPIVADRGKTGVSASNR